MNGLRTIVGRHHRRRLLATETTLAAELATTNLKYDGGPAAID